MICSNHGGRQVDGALASLDALPGIVAAANGLAVLFDSGIRTGADIAKALALGADAVLIGRPYVHGLAIGGEDGVHHVLRGLLADMDLQSGLAGYASVAELSPDSLVRTRTCVKRLKSSPGSAKLPGENRVNRTSQRIS